MRSSISAQSCDSVPPAPGWMVTIAFLRSCSPPSIFLISAGLDFLLELVEGLRELGVDGLARLGPLDEHGEIVGCGVFSDSTSVAILLEPAAALQELLRFGLVLPEVGRGGARLEAGQFVVRGGRPQR